MYTLKLFPPPSLTRLAAGLALLVIASTSAQAASDSWNVNAAGNWATAGSWLGGNIPGSTASTTNTDLATFAFTLTADRTVTVDANRNIGGITFGSNNTNFKYTLSGGNLLLTNGGVIQVDSTATSGTNTATISSAIAIQGDGGSATFTNNGASTRLLSIGAVTGVSTGTNVTTLTLSGSNTGESVITGTIGNGANGGRLAITKSDAGTWRLAVANTLTGGIAINNGLLIANIAGALGTSANTTTFGGGNLELRGASLTFTGKLDLSGANQTIFINRGAAGIGVTNIVSGGSVIGGRTTTISSAGSPTIDTAYGLTFSTNTATLTGNQTFTINGNGTGIGTLTFSGGFDTQGATRTLTFNNGTGTSAAVVSGAFTGTAGTLELAGTTPTVTIGSLTGATANALQLSGSGTYNLNGTSTFTGGVILNNASATYNVTAGGALGIGGKAKFNVGGVALNLRNTGNLSFTSGMDSTVNGGSIVIDRGAASATATTHTLSSANALGTNTVNVSAGSNITAGTAYGLILSGTSVLSGNPTFTINGNGGGVGTLTLSGGFNTGGVDRTLTVNGGTSVAVISGVFTGSASTLELAGTTPTVTIGSLTGATAHALQLSGSGTYNLNGTSTFTGGVILNNASATYNAILGGALGNGGPVKFGVAGTTLNLLPVLNNTTFTAGLDSSSYGGTVTVGRSTTPGGANTHIMSGANTFGTNTVTVSPGPNETTYGLNLTGHNTLTGDATFAVNFNSGSNATLTMGGGFNVNGATRTLTLNNASGTTNNFTIGGGFTGSGGTLRLAGNAAAVTVNPLTEVATSNAVELAALSTSVYTFTGTHTFAGGLTLTSGIAAISNDRSFGTGLITLNGGTLRNVSGGRTLANNLTISTGGTFDLQGGNGQGLTFTGTTNINSSFVYQVTATGATSKHLTFNGQTNLGADATITGDHNNIPAAASGSLIFSSTGVNTLAFSANRTLTFNDTGAVIFRGNLAGGSNTLTLASTSGTTKAISFGDATAAVGGSAGGVIVNAANLTVTFGTTLANTFTGGVTVQSGTARLGVNNGIASDNVLTVNGGVYDLNNFDSSIAGLSAASAGGNVDNTGATAKTLTLSGTGNYSYAGTINPAVIARLNLVKSGNGTQTLTNDSTFSGTTTVTAGTLLINNTPGVGSGLGTSNVAVNGSGRFGGTGEIYGTVTVGSGGTLAPGASIATFYTGALSMTDTSIYASELDSTVATSVGSDLLGVNGSFSLTGTVDLQLTYIAGTQFAGGTVFSLINYSGAWNNGLFTYAGNTVADGGTFTLNGQAWTLDYNATSGGANFVSEQFYANFVNITVVPEPGTFALLAAGLTLVTVFRRRR